MLGSGMVVVPFPNTRLVKAEGDVDPVSLAGDAGIVKVKVTTSIIVILSSVPGNDAETATEVKLGSGAVTVAPCPKVNGKEDASEKEIPSLADAADVNSDAYAVAVRVVPFP